MMPDLPQTEVAIVEMTNAFRKANALQEVKPNAALAAAARAFADYLARTGKFAHEADGRKPEQRAEAQGYRYCLVAENLAWNLNSRGYESRQLAREIMEGWKDSPGHRENLLLRGVTEIGVAVVRAQDKHPKFVSVQLVGRPESLKVTFNIENRSNTAVRYALGAEAETVQPRQIVTHTACEPGQLSFNGASQSPAHFDPRDGDRFVIRSGAGRAIKVDVERR
jgi:Cysteine-rich secretory protein family